MHLCTALAFSLLLHWLALLQLLRLASLIKPDSLCHSDESSPRSNRACSIGACRSASRAARWAGRSARWANVSLGGMEGTDGIQ